MFKTKKINVMISLLIAVALWAYVVGEINPTVNRNFSEIPIKLSNEDALLDNGLAVVSVSDATLNASVSGTRSVVSQIEAGDITASVDLSNAGKGGNQLSVEVKTPSKTELEKQSVSKVTVVVEDSNTEKKNIQVEYTGSYGDNEEPTVVKLSREQVEVTGAKSLVNKVDHVKATVNAGKVSSSEKTTEAELVAVDARGEAVNNVKLSAKTVKVTSIMSAVKTVDLIVPINDATADEVNKITSPPKSIVIKGKKEDLENLTSITTEAVDISNITQSTEITLEPIFPENITVSQRSISLIMKVTISSNTKKKITFSGSEVSFTGLGAGLSASSTSEITVMVEGSETQVSKISKADISISADLSGLGPGNHSVAIAIESSKKYGRLTPNIGEISVDIQ